MNYLNELISQPQNLEVAASFLTLFFFAGHFVDLFFMFIKLSLGYKVALLFLWLHLMLSKIFRTWHWFTLCFFNIIDYKLCFRLVILFYILNDGFTDISYITVGLLNLASSAWKCERKWNAVWDWRLKLGFSLSFLNTQTFFERHKLAYTLL